MKRILVAIVLVCQFFVAFAFEGMWIPSLVEQQILPNMQELGCRLSPEQIYSIQQACLKDAVVRLGQGCTASFISSDGLLLTNFHCVQHYVSKASNVENNYIEKGFFAHKRDDEIPTSRLSVECLVAMYDITDSVLGAMEHGEHSFSTIAEKMTIDSSQDFQYSIEEFYAGNQFFLCKTKQYADVRLVACMPADLAQFGGDTDNWQWPRNSADFALLRVYENDEPMHPRNFLKINVSGVQENDFSMVIGYPAETKLHGTSHELECILKVLNPAQIEMRKIRLEPIQAYMSRGANEYGEYYALYSSLSNYYEKWQGENYGIKHSHAIQYRQEQEKKIQQLLQDSDSLFAIYGSLIDDYNTSVDAYYNAYTDIVVYLEGLWRMRTFLPPSVVAMAPEMSYVRGERFLNNMAKYNVEIERDALVNMLKFIAFRCQDDSTKLFPILRRLCLESKEQQSDEPFQLFVDSVCTTSVFTDINRAKEFQQLILTKKKFQKDAKIKTYLYKHDILYRMTEELYRTLNNDINPRYYTTKIVYDSLCQKLQSFLLTQCETIFPPDANGTMRVSFGQVKSYSVAKMDDSLNFDTIHYNWYSTEKEFLEKLSHNPKVYKYDSLFVSLLEKKQFGTYFTDSLVMNFIATNQTSGGNSGSPVLDADGYLIGLNFDRNWEGTMSDYFYEEDFCRNISVDIRYVLFCLEQYGKATNLIAEMQFK